MREMIFINCTPKDIPHLCCIYKITNMLNGKVYIGQTINLNGRYGNHKSGKSSLFIHGAIRKYGFKNFKLEVIEEVPKKLKVMNDREIYWINHYNSCDPEIGYNYSTVGQTNLGHVVTQATRLKLSIIHAERMKDKTNNPMYGKRHSSESIEKMKLTRNSRKHLHKVFTKQVILLDTETREEVLFNKVGDLAKHLGFGSSFISTVKNKRNGIYKHYIIKDK